MGDVDEVRRVERRLRRNRPPLRISDYIAQPRKSGYRGIHLIVSYDDRAIEVQLRTKAMHEWAIAVERLSWRMDEDLKSSRGPQPVLEWLEAVSEVMALEDAGCSVTSELADRIAVLREGAVPHLGER